MRHLSILFLTIIINIFVLETIDFLGLYNFKPKLEAAWVAEGYTLSWPKLPSINYYEPAILESQPESGKDPAKRPTQSLLSRALQNQFAISRTSLFGTGRLSAQGLSPQQSGPAPNSSNMPQPPGDSQEAQVTKPKATSFFPQTAPAPNKPFLTWTVIPGAVYYEIELLNAPPENPNGTEPSIYRIFFSRQVYTNGYNPDLSNYQNDSLYWRVRALDYDGTDLGVFSDAQQVFVDHAKQVPLKPQLTNIANVNDMAAPLYPVYSWIPINGAVSYEVEILRQPPENPNGTEPSVFRIDRKQATGFDCYDDESRNLPGTYYWRVRGLDANGRQVGVFSDTGQFVVDFSRGNYAATFGDSITHGGGAISSPPADPAYCYQTYLTFPVVNLGKSGDTSGTMAERFSRDVLPYHPKYLLILGGTNSLRGSTSANRVIADLTVIRDKCLAQGIRPIFLTLPPINPAAIKRAFGENTALNWRQKFDTVNNFIRQQRYYIDLDPYLCDDTRRLPRRFGIDGLHPDIEGKKVMGRIINTYWSEVTQ